MALILSKLDNGIGILDRFLMMVLYSARSLPSEQIAATARLDEQAFKDFNRIYHTLIKSTNLENPVIFYFSKDAQRFVLNFLQNCSLIFNILLVTIELLSCM